MIICATSPQTGQLTIDIHLSAAVNITAILARRKVNALLAAQVGNLLSSLSRRNGFE